MQSRCYGDIVEHKFSYCQGENVAGIGVNCQLAALIGDSLALTRK